MQAAKETQAEMGNKNNKTSKEMKKRLQLEEDILYQMNIFDRQLPCKLCQKPIKKFTRRVSKCLWCLDMVCNSCLTHKCNAPATNRNIKVCDGCFGFIGYWNSDINHTPIQFSITKSMTKLEQQLMQPNYNNNRSPKSKSKSGGGGGGGGGGGD